MKHLKRFNELYDSDDAKKLKVSPEELKKMTAMDFEHSYEPGKWVGKNSADLNIGISNYKYSDKVTKFNRYGILDVLHNKIIKAIPDIVKFKLNTDGLDSERKLSYNREIILDVPNMDDDYSIKMNLWIEYIFSEDDILGYKENTIRLLFYPEITTTRVSVDLNDIGGIKSVGADNGVDISDDEVSRVLFKLNNLLDGAPDEEDINKRKEFYIDKSNLSLDEFEKALSQVKNSLNRFSSYIYGKYGIKII